MVGVGWFVEIVCGVVARWRVWRIVDLPEFSNPMNIMLHCFLYNPRDARKFEKAVMLSLFSGNV